MASAATIRPYLCVAVKPGGGRRLAVRSAASESALAAGMRKEKLTVLRSYPLPRLLAPAPKRMGLKDHAVLNEQLFQLLSRGVPLVEALQVAAGTVTNAGRPIVNQIREAVAQGTSFADACLKTGHFDAVNVAVYRAAERSGDLAGAAKQLSIAARRTVSVTEKARTIMIYPVVLLVVALLVSSMLLIVVLPNLGDTLLNLGGDVPLYTRVLVKVGTWMRDNILIVLLLAAGLVTVIVVWRRGLALWGLSVSRRMPVVRDVLLAAETARFFAVMSAMSKAGVPLAEGLATANKVILHPRLRKQLDRLRERLVSGGILRNLIEEVEALPLATRRLLLAAERAGDMENAFSSLAGDMTDEVERQATRLLAVLQPAMIVLMTMFIGGLLLAILVPILTMAGKVG
jgi:type IV pilus assembly protein PilC